MNFSTRSKRRGLTDINLTPLVDIVFILLIFFLITSTFVQSPGIDVTLPKAKSSADTTEAQSVVVTVTETGQLVYGGEEMDVGALQAALETIFKETPNRQIVIQADEETDHGAVVEAMDAARAAGFLRLGIATQAAP
jgi:biopolymer transport protein ExbD